MSTTNISMCPEWCAVDHVNRERAARSRFKLAVDSGMIDNITEEQHDLELQVMEGRVMHESNYGGHSLAGIATIDPESGAARVVIDPELLESDLTPGVARNLAAALIDAADRLEDTHD